MAVVKAFRHSLETGMVQAAADTIAALAPRRGGPTMLEEDEAYVAALTFMRELLKLPEGPDTRTSADSLASGLGPETILQKAQRFVLAGFYSVLEGKLDLEVTYVDSFPKAGLGEPGGIDANSVSTYAKMVECSVLELPEACMNLGRSAAAKLLDVIASTPDAKSVTFLWHPHPVVASTTEEGDRVTVQGYFDFGVSP